MVASATKQIMVDKGFEQPHRVVVIFKPVLRDAPKVKEARLGTLMSRSCIAPSPVRFTFTDEIWGKVSAIVIGSAKKRYQYLAALATVRNLTAGALMG